MEMTGTVDAPVEFDEIDALIGALDTQFGEARTMPRNHYPPPTITCSDIDMSCGC